MLMLWESSVEHAIQAATRFGRFYCKFVSANDAGMTGSHQAGVYIAKAAWPLFFDTPGLDGENKEVEINVYWQDGYPPIKSVAKWYGASKWKNEYRVTRFWSKSSFDVLEHVGDLLVLVQAEQGEFFGFLFSTEQSIETFLNTFSIPLTERSYYFDATTAETETMADLIQHYASRFVSHFPPSPDLAEEARRISRTGRRLSDGALLKWIETEYSLFRAIEEHVYHDKLVTPFGALEHLIEFANTALNRRKSRAGRSLEHHIDHILTEENIPFAHPGRTEGNKKPDFLLPSNEAYADLTYEIGKLTFLGVKTTCKDRWRQVLNEADRIPTKHLLTLQQGITKNQLDEMKKANVVLVVPGKYHDAYPKEYRDDLLSVSNFVAQMKERYA